MVVGLIAPSSNCNFSQNTTHRTCILYTPVHLDFLHFAESYHRSMPQSSTYSFLDAFFSRILFSQISCHRHHLKTVSIVPILCCDWYLKLYFVTSNFHRDTGVGERMEKGTMPLHLQKDVLNDFVQGHTIIYIYFQTLKPLRSSNYIYISLTRLIKHR